MCIALFMLFLLLTVGTRNQVQFWRNSITLFEHAIEVTSDNSVAHSNLENALNRQEASDRGIRYDNP